jgi:hypothetical protein
MDSLHALRHGPGATGAVDRDYTSAVYGSLLVTTLIAVQWRYDATATFIGLSLVVSVAVFWVAHVWSAIVDRRVHGPVSRHVVIELGREEAPMLAAAIVPAAIMGLAVIDVATVDQAIGLALIASIVQLFVWGLAVGRVAHSSWGLALAVATVDALLGIAIVVLKVVIIH